LLIVVSVASNTLKVMISQNHYTPITDALRACQLEPGELEGRVVLISGASGGLGTVLSQACARAGATVVLVARKLAKLEALYDSIEQIDGAPQPAIITLDQANAPEADYQHLTQIVASEFGHLDALVHTAADLGVLSPLQLIPQADWTRVMSVNLTSVRLLTNACLPLMNSSDNASVTYTLDIKTSAYWGAYGVSKIALMQLAGMTFDETEKQCAQDGAAKVAINAIDPGAMRTPLRRKAFPGELETESPRPETKLGPFLSLISRRDRHLNGATLKWAD